MEDIFGIFGTDVSAGDLSIDIAGCDVVTFDTTVRAAAKFKRAVDIRVDDIGEVEEKDLLSGVCKQI
ncbi:unnamed protein product [Hymenolepis diminuta]|uniref:RRM domain-containing protein n=1 Tax=Hymenolepis diminuta TaxID=6216 RepID=A0A0R3SP00_HYMDI|nr:unnamed protein product [Hymenolepis diminuta]